MKARTSLIGAIALAHLTCLTNVNAADVARVACIGDSITAGGGTNSYPALLQKLLGDKYEVKNFGVSGTTLLKHGDHPYWNTKQFTDATQFDPNVVTIKLGTNDTKPQNMKFKDE